LLTDEQIDPSHEQVDPADVTLNDSDLSDIGRALHAVTVYIYLNYDVFKKLTHVHV
jgi:hypothetical protein